MITLFEHEKVSIIHMIGPYLIKGKAVLLIGTAHVSQNSANIVRDAVNKLRPELVMIEMSNEASRLSR